MDEMVFGLGEGAGEAGTHRYTYPPLNAPTGFRTGRAAVAVASWNRRADEWNGREVWVWGRGESVVDVRREARIEGVRILEAMVGGGKEGRTERVEFFGCNFGCLARVCVCVEK